MRSSVDGLALQIMLAARSVMSNTARGVTTRPICAIITVRMPLAFDKPDSLVHTFAQPTFANVSLMSVRDDSYVSSLCVYQHAVSGSAVQDLSVLRYRVRR